MAPPSGRKKTTAKGKRIVSERLVQAARTIIIRDGLAALTFASIESESGASRSLIHYHFGGRDGLLMAVVDSIFDAWRQESEADAALDGDEQTRLMASLDLDERMSADRETMTLFVELLPHILRAPELCERLRAEYREGSFLERRVLTSVSTDVERNDLAGLMIAMVDGLGLQLLVDPDHVQHPRLFQAWKDVVLQFVQSKPPHQE